MDHTVLSTQDLTVGYQEPLIREICLDLRQGEIVALIGPNGAGKTTVLKSILRQLAPLSGVILLKGEDLTARSLRDTARLTAAVQTGRFPAELMTVEDVVSAGRYPYTGAFGLLSAEDHQKVREAMETVQVADLAGRDFNCLSDGQRQRVLLARALCQEPELLVLDEPTSFLDIRYKLEFLSILRQLTAQKKLSVLLSLHELELAQRAADKIACIHGDRIVRFGPPEEIFVPGFIPALFDMQSGSYDPLSGSVELERVSGPARVFVLAGGGCGTSVFRRLQRAGIAFSAGILWQNDLDQPAAQALAVQVLTAPAFSALTQAQLEAAMRCIDETETTIAALPEAQMTGAAAPLAQLVEYARSAGKLREAPE